MGEALERPRPMTEEERHDPGSAPGDPPGSAASEPALDEAVADRTRPGGSDPSPDKDPADPAPAATGG